MFPPDHFSGWKSSGFAGNFQRVRHWQA